MYICRQRRCELASPLRIHKRPRLIKPSLVVGWTDAGHVGINTIEYLINQLGATEFAEIEPHIFSLMPHASIKGGVLQHIEYQQNDFYYWKNLKSAGDLILFGSRPPIINQYELINLILDLADTFNVNRIYTVGGMQSNTAHTAEIGIFGIVNSAALKPFMAEYDVRLSTDYHGPTSINGMLSGTAKQRGIECINMWARVPNYISEIPNPRISIAVLDILTRILDIDFDFTEIENEATNADKQIERLVNYLRQQNPDIDRHIKSLERNTIPEANKEERLRFFEELEDFLRDQQGN